MWLVNNNPTPLLVLHKWMILKGVEVVCFDTLLQVLILKEMEEGSGVGEEWDEARTRDLPQRHRGHRGDEGMDGERRKGDTPVATGSMRNVLRTGEILTLRGACDGRSRRLREHTRGCGSRKGRNGDTVSRTLG